MKVSTTLSLFLSLTGCAVGYDWDPEELECLEGHKINQTLIEKLNNPIEKRVVGDDEALELFYECSWKKYGMLDGDDHFDWDKVEFVFLRNIRQDYRNAKTESEQAMALVMGGIARRIIGKCREKCTEEETPGLSIIKIQNCWGERLRLLKGVLDD